MLVLKLNVVTSPNLEARGSRQLLDFAPTQGCQDAPNFGNVRGKIVFRLKIPVESKIWRVRDWVVAVTLLPIGRSLRKAVVEAAVQREFPLILPPREAITIAMLKGETDCCGNLE
jgi:hypothetical protein